MSRKARKQYSPQEKVAILREHLLEGKAVSEVCQRHHRQMVTGLVVNGRVNLPRPVRRWLRAVEHRFHTAQSSWPEPSESFPARKKPTLSAQQLEGWRSLQSMTLRQAGDTS